MNFLRVAVAAVLLGTGCRTPWTDPGGEAGPLKIASVYDAGAHAAANRSGRNHWDLYLREIADQLGLQAEEIGPETLEDARRLTPYATILLGDVAVSETARGNLDRWVRGGGTLIALGTQGLDGLCGNRADRKVPQPDDPFTCAAGFALQPHALSRDIHSPLQPAQQLLIFSDAHPVRPDGSDELARLFDRAGQDTGLAAVTARSLDRGRAFYFGFSVPQTVWVLHQGRPVDGDRDGDKYLRRSDAIVIRPNSIEVAYADEILFLLQNMIGARPHPFVHQLPPSADGIPDAMFFWGGDDEGAADGIQLVASNFMKERGLPYHINALPRKDGTYGLSVEDARKIRANGHELSIHYNFIDNYKPGAAFTREELLAQAAEFQRVFGVKQVCSVNHWVRWTGYAEPAKWMLEAGGKADNSFVHSSSPPLDPSNLMGFSFGTVFPFWFYDDWRGGNRRIDFLEQPIAAYECGYTKQATDFAMVRKVMDQAARYHATMNMFHHPIYIAKNPHCRSAIDEGLRYLKERKIAAVHLGPDELYEWWKARSESRVGGVTADGGRLRIETECAFPRGMVVKVPRASRSVTANGTPTRFRNETRFGRSWTLAVAPAGKAQLELVLE